VYSRLALGVLAIVHTVASFSSANAQATNVNACTVISTAELKRITGRQDFLGRGPQPADPSETPKGVTECEHLALSFSLTSAMTHDWFVETQKSQVKDGTKVSPVSDVGDEAYLWWDPKSETNAQVGIAFRVGARRLVIMDLTSRDSIEALKPMLVSVAKAAVPNLR